MPIDSSKFNSPILKRIAEGDLSVVNYINQDNANITENIGYQGTLTPLPVAAYNGHIEIVNRLLAKKDDGSYEFLRVVQNIAIANNYALRFAARNGHIEVVNRLLAKRDDDFYEFKDVIESIAVDSNCALRWAAYNGHIEVVNRLLAKRDDGSYELPVVIQNVAALDNYVLRHAAENGHYEISYILARTQWPNGACQMPKELHCYLPSIQRGARVADGRNDALQVLRCLQEGTNELSIYSPVCSTGSHIPFDIAYNIANLSGINGKVKLVKDCFGNAVEDNATPIEVKYREYAMKKRAAPAA